MNKKDMTLEDLRSALGRALQQEGQRYAYVSEVWPFESRFAYGTDGGTYSRSYQLADDGTVTLGDDTTEVQARLVWEPVAMAMFSAGPAYVEWQGEVFRAGHYPDKGCTITREDLVSWAENWQPARLSIEHIDTPLDKALEGFGLIEKPEVRGDKLYGKVRVPTWLHEGMKDLPRKVSVGLYSDHSGIEHISLVRNPRVPTAQVFAGEAAQALIDSAPQFSLDQRIRDLAALATTTPPPTRGQETPMKDKIRQFLFGLSPEQKQAAGITDESIDAALTDSAPTNKPDEKPAFSDPVAAARIAALEQQVNAQAAQGRAAAAQHFYADMLAAGKVLPAQREHVVALFGSALEADAAGGATFGQDGPQVTAVKALFNSQPRLFHSAPAIANAPANDVSPFDMTPEKARQALGIQEKK